jgi:hypothetical protein
MGLNVKIVGLRFRKGDGLSAERQAAIMQQRLSTHLPKLPHRPGDDPSGLGIHLSMRQSSAVAVSPLGCEPVIVVPALCAPVQVNVLTIAVPGERFEIMINYPTTRQFQLFVTEKKYPIGGSNERYFQAAFQANDDSPMVDFVSPKDGEAFAGWLSGKTDQRWRLPTGKEWRAAKENVGNQLIGNCSELATYRAIFSHKYLGLRLAEGAIYKNEVSPDCRLRGQTIRLVRFGAKH